jgi:hypothetical protein
MRTVTMRTVFERQAVLKILQEPEFRDSTEASIVRDNKPTREHYLAVFVFSAESQNDGSLRLRVTSTTLLGIQRYTTARLRGQGVYVMEKLHEHGLFSETLRAHFRAEQKLLLERMESVGLHGMHLSWFKKHFANEAGDLSSPPEFVIADPDFEELEKLFKPQDTDLDETEE